MSEIQIQHYKRWYDRTPELSEASRVLMLLPDEITEIVCEAVVKMANREFQVKEKIKTFRSLGTDKVMALHKSKKKQRKYDDSQILHKTMNYLYILSHANQDYMAHHILKLMSYIQEYLSTVKTFNAEPSMDTIAEITQQYVERGSKDVEKFLTILKERLHQEMLLRDDDDAIDFIEDDSGMKVVETE